MRISWRLALRMFLIAVAIALVWWRIISLRSGPSQPANDLSRSSPLNRPGGSFAPAEAYEIYSALYQSPSSDALAFSDESLTDIPQVGGSCLKPSNPAEHEMADSFVAANQQSHRWERKFSILQPYRMVPAPELSRLQACLASHGRSDDDCKKYKGFSYVRLLGVPGSDRSHTRALISVIKSCGKFCGTGGIFEVEKNGGSWQRSAPSDFTRDCSWMY